ncbi:hypothetical protein D3C75_185820 [compost metagenome]
MKLKKMILTLIVIGIVGAALWLARNEITTLMLDQFRDHRPEPKISSIKEHFHADQVTKIGPFSTDLVKTSPYMYGYLLKKGAESSVIVLDQYWGRTGNSDYYITILPGQKITLDDRDAIDALVKHAPESMNLQASDIVGKNLVEVHQDSSVTKLPAYKLKAYSSGNLQWMTKNLQQVLTYKEGLEALRDY